MRYIFFITVLLLGLSLSITTQAINLDGTFSGRWDRVHADHNHFIYIGPSFILFNDCGMTKMLEYRFLGENFYDRLTLRKQEHEMVLEVKKHLETRCMRPGKHVCSAYVMHWGNNRPDKMSLLLSCDESEFFRVYEREIPQEPKPEPDSLRVVGYM